MQSIIEYKSIATDQHTLTNIDEKQGIISGYFSMFGNVDSDNDIIMPGAFTKTIQENLKRVKHLYQHDPWKPLSGVKNGMLAIREDVNGLAFDSTISQTSWGKDVIKLYADGVIDEHSVGFRTIKSSEKAGTGVRELQELQLWEGSTVTWGANSMAGTTSVKSLDKESVITKMDKVIKAIRNGKYEHEEIFDMLELYFKQLQQQILDLTHKSTTPPIDGTLPGFEVKDVIKQFLQTI